LLITASILALLWWIALALLAVFTANPVTLNREQIRRAQYVVMATVNDPRQGRVTVEREWKRNALHGAITVENLAAAAPRAGVSYLIPLTPAGKEYGITDAPLPKSVSLIYPATPDAMAQLQAILRTEQ
jgi:hypothetical protein